MNECPHTPQVHAYHDGELSAPSRDMMAEHLRRCEVCAAELAFLERTRAWLVSAPTPPLPTDVMELLKNRVVHEPFRPVLRLAWWLTASAAAVVVFCVTQLAPQNSAATEPPPTWEVLSYADVAEEPASPVSDDLQLARWFAQDLRSAGGNRP